MSPVYIGLISGTSVDAIDAALVDFSGASPQLLEFEEYPWPDALRTELIAVGREGRRLDAGAWGRLDARVAEVFTAAAGDLLKAASIRPGDVRAIGSHGQTLFHAPDETPPFTVQLGDGAAIAGRTGIDVVADFRRADLAAGGQGAPLAPLIHQVLFASPSETRAVINLGGIANVTWLRPGQAPEGFDTGPANGLMDAWCLRHRGQAMDSGGQWAAGGQVVPELLDRLLADPYFRRVPPKATGTEYFNLDWLEERGPGSIEPRDVQATLLALTARSLAENLAGSRRPDRVLLTGGGVHNEALIDAIARALDPVPVEPAAAPGISADAMEAVLFAWLAREHVEGRAVDTRSITGARHPVRLGALYPAGHPVVDVSKTRPPDVR